MTFDLDSARAQFPALSIVDGLSPDSIAKNLSTQNIFVWSGEYHAIEVTKSLDVYDSGGTVRVGPVHYNSIAETDLFLNALDDTLPRANVA